MTSRVSDAVARPVRTITQIAPAYVVTEFWDSFITDLTEKQYGALVALLTLLIGTTQVLIEDYVGKGFLRKMPSGTVEVIDEGKTQ